MSIEAAAGACRPPHRPSSESQRHRHGVHAVGRAPVLVLRRLPQRGHPPGGHPARADRRVRRGGLVEGDADTWGGGADCRAGRHQRHERDGGRTTEPVAAGGARWPRAGAAVGAGLAAGDRPRAVRRAAGAVCRDRDLGRVRGAAGRPGAARRRDRAVGRGVRRLPDGPRVLRGTRPAAARRAFRRALRSCRGGRRTGPRRGVARPALRGR